MFQQKKKFELSARLKLGVGRGYTHNQVLKYGAMVCLIAACVLAFNAIRLAFFGNLSTPTRAESLPQVLGATDTKPETQQSAPQFIEHKVQKGDTLFNVAQKHNISWTTLATLNNLKSPFTLKAGQILKVPR